MLNNHQQWIASLYFFQAIPYFFITIVVSLMYQSYGFENGTTVFWVSLLSLPWAIKPLFSPLLEKYQDKKKLIILMQLGFAVSYFILFSTSNTPLFISLSFLCFFIITLFSSLNDTLCDGVYLQVLDAQQQQSYVGIRTICYQLGLLFIKGFMLMLIGKLSLRLGVNHWQLMFFMLGLTCVGFAVFHQSKLPNPTIPPMDITPSSMLVFKKVITASMIPALVLSFFFNMPDAQLQKIVPLFLGDSNTMHLSLSQIGKIYGLFGGTAFIAGVALSSQLLKRFELNKYLIAMLCLLLLRPLLLGLLSNDYIALVYIIIPITQGITGMANGAYMGFLMHIASKSPYPMSAYTICTSIMALSYIFFGAVGGYIQQCLGYGYFFIYLFVSNLFVLFLSLRLYNE